MGAEIMTLEMRDREKRKEGEIYGIIDVCRKNNFSEESIMKILQEGNYLKKVQRYILKKQVCYGERV